MSSDLAIRARGLGKCYPIFNRPEDRLKQMLSFGRRKYYHEFWALRDFDLEVLRGETVGIVGRNGSGKSTLLQMICGTLSPTTGSLAVSGRVAALLELGAGFNTEFTGRENVFMNASILGLSRGEIERRFEDIAAFADIGEFLNQPVKMYSSGMYARLAFAVAINVDADILIVDEALSVGDEAFQRKCFARIQKFRERGGTILFVSHSAGTIVELCSRAVLLDNGERLITGAPKMVVGLYQKLLYARGDRAAICSEIKIRDRASSPSAAATAAVASGPSSGVGDDEPEFDSELNPKSTLEYPSHGATIDDVHIEDETGRRVNILISGHVYRYCYKVVFTEKLQNVRFGMLLKAVSGLEIAGQVVPVDDGINVEAGEQYDVSFAFENRFLAGTYFGNAGVVTASENGDAYLHRIIDATMFRVKPIPHESVTALLDLRPKADRGIRVKRSGYTTFESAEHAKRRA